MILIINLLYNMQMKKFIFLILIAVLFYTRFVNLGWGLPYPMHPDERNMAVAVQQLSCPPLSSLITCFNPHFFAYGQFPLYLAYGGVQIYHDIIGEVGPPTFLEATLALRTISALSSILLVFILIKIITLFFPKKRLSTFDLRLLTLIFFIFQPYAIQFAHFGTTESLLMLFYCLIIYFSLLLLSTFDLRLSVKYLLLAGIFSGLSLGTKTSSILFLGVPIVIIIMKELAGGRIEGAQQRAQTATPIRHLARLEHWWEALKSDRICQLIIKIFLYIFTSLLFFILSSPQSFLNWNDFISSMNYESSVGLGTYLPFYTRQFTGTIPIVFQFQHILPYVLGWPQLILGILGFVFLPWKIKKNRQELLISILMNPYNILRFALLLSFLPPSFFFAKWTRFISSSFPLFSLFAILFLLQYAKKNIKVITIIIFITVIPGISFLSIYTSPDIRFTASEWIYKNIPSNSKIISETANVIDIPVGAHSYLLNSLNFYDLDSDRQIQIALSEALNDAEYIIIPSRRIFKNHPNNLFPFVSNYYENLFSGELGFEKVAEFSSFPKIEMFGKTLLEFPDENAEETWTVFDHPVIRIYKRSQKSKRLKVLKAESQQQKTNLDFSAYKTIDFQLLDLQTFRLLVADTPEKWETGLMYVKNKQDIGGLDGMIFTFPDSQKRTFWNKNTLSHLTLYWINKGKVIGESDLASITETKEVITVTSPGNADTVVELLR